MKLEILLAKRKSLILKKWFERVVETYPPDTSRFFKNKKDPFSNPVGRTTFQSLEALLDQLLNEIDYDKTASILDPMIRIRAVQDFSPSQATAVFFKLKDIVREVLGKDVRESQMINDLLNFESKIDEISLIAFDIYMKCREKIYELKANEVRSRSFKAFERAGLISEVPAAEPERNESKPH